MTCDRVRPLDGRVAKIKHSGYCIALIAVYSTSCATCFSANADSSSDASQNNFTAEESADNQLLEEIIITAQKRPERLEDIPVAAQVVSSQALAAANVADLSDLNNLVPSVELNGTINGRVPTGIGGISSVSSEGAVGIHPGSPS